MNTPKDFIWKVFMIMLKAVKMFQTLLVNVFYMTTDKSINLSHKNIHMAAQIARPTAFTLNIFLLNFSLKSFWNF